MVSGGPSGLTGLWRVLVHALTDVAIECRPFGPEERLTNVRSKCCQQRTITNVSERLQPTSGEITTNPARSLPRRGLIASNNDRDREGLSPFDFAGRSKSLLSAYPCASRIALMISSSLGRNNPSGRTSL